MKHNINKNKIKFFQKNILSWYSEHGRKFPWRKKNITIYQRIISEILLQRTKAETIENFFPIFIKKYSSWKQLANCSKKSLEKTLKPIGLYKQRSTKLMELAREMTKRNGRFPTSQEELESIPFMGQYIANSVMLFVHNQPKPLLDVNMARVLERFFGPRDLIDIRYDSYLQELSEQVVAHQNSKEINWGILDFAAVICKKINQTCPQCKLKNECLYHINNFGHKIFKINEFIQM